MKCEPVTVREIAAKIGEPLESVRRLLERFADLGLLKRVQLPDGEQGYGPTAKGRFEAAMRGE